MYLFLCRTGPGCDKPDGSPMGDGGCQCNQVRVFIMKLLESFYMIQTNLLWLFITK